MLPTLSSSDLQGLRDSRPTLPPLDLAATTAGERSQFLQIPSITLSPDGSLTARRLSLSPGRKPLRSSPLAGPSVSPLVITEDADYDNVSDARLAKPEKIVLPQLPAKTLVPRPKSSDGVMPIPGRRLSIAWDGSVSNVRLSPLDTLRRPEKHKLKRPRSAHSPADAYNYLCPQDIPVAVVDEKSRYLPTPSTPTSRRPHSFYIDPTAVPRASFLSPEPAPKSPSPLPADNSWYIASPYDVTPRFSRLGLAASNVVLPVSAKTHRPGKPSTLDLRSSQSSSTLKARSTISKKLPRSAGSTPQSSTANQSSSTPSLTLSSSIESSDTDGGPPTPSPTSTTDVSTPTVRGHERRKFSFSRMRKNSLARVRSLRFKSIHTNPYPAFEQEIALSDRPYEAVVQPQVVVLSSPKTSFLDMEELSVQNEPQATPKPEPLSRGGTIKRLWKTLAGGAKSRS